MTMIPAVASIGAVLTVAVLSTQAAHARRYRTAPNPYATPQYTAPGYAARRPSAPAYGGNGRFTPEEQRIIDSITNNNWTLGR
jgi:hypothetical protein